MSGTTAVPAPTLGPNGFIIPTDSQVLAGVQSDINNCFGGNLNPALETPQGQLATTETAIITDKNDQFLFLSQMCDPAYAQGRYQDALARIYFITRNPAEPTVVDCLCTGLGNVVIPAGTQATDGQGNFYIARNTGTISPATGNVLIEFANTTYGPIACPANSVTTVYQVIPGWDSITNPLDGIVGSDVESRTAFELRRQQSVANNSIGQLPSIIGAVLAVPGVLDAYVTENWTAAPLTVGGVTLVPHSIYVAVAGGTNIDIATAIWAKKSTGSNYNGNTTVTVQDTSAWYSTPYPSYPVTFQRPAQIEIAFSVVIQQNQNIPFDALTQIQNAILAAFAGTDGGPRARIGQPVLASRYYCAVTGLGQWAQLLTLTVGATGSDATSFTGTIGGLTLTVSAIPAGGHIKVDDLIEGPGVQPATFVTGLGTGTGGVGTYSIGVSQLVSITTMSATSFDIEVPMTLAQIPVCSANDINLTITP
jgi:uncharacterized phage protein gp47/JayE